MNNPNTKPAALSPAQDREYAWMQRKEMALAYIATHGKDDDERNNALDRLSDHQSAMQAFLEDLGITEI